MVEKIKQTERRAPKAEKVAAVEALAREIAQRPVIGMLNMYKLPAAALQRIKYELHGKATIRVVKKSAIRFALEQLADKKALAELLTAQPALLLTDMSPFRLYRFLQTIKSPIAAKAGDVAQRDIDVRAGPTGLMPGPAITTLTKVGIRAKVEAGKIAIMADRVVCRAGEIVSPELATALQLLKLEPMEIGLDVAAIWEAGAIYKKDVLAVDEVKLLADIGLAAQQAINLAINTGWPTRQTVPLMIQKAFMSARALGTEAAILDSGVIEALLARAKAAAECLAVKASK